VFLVTIENLAAGLARYADPGTHYHGLPIRDAGHTAQAFFRRRNSLPPRHTFRRKKSEKCNPCVGFGMINYVSGRSTVIDALVARLKRSDQPPQYPFR
jgi:hypothetical protein